MTDEKCEHEWRDWERVVHGPGHENPKAPTGDRARECQRCGRWEIQWAEEAK